MIFANKKFYKKKPNKDLSSKWNLKNKKALITGATRGIGKATVEEFCELGAEVYIVSRNENDIKEQLKVYAGNGFKVNGMKCDVTNAGERTQLFNEINFLWGKLDVLVNNAGTNTRKKTLENSEEDFDRLMDLNLKSSFELCKLFHSLLRQSGKASIVNVVSVAGITFVGTGSPYSLSKAAMIQLTKYLSVEWSKENIRVNAVAPWYIKTSLTEPVIQNREYLESILNRTPMKRIGEAEEVASVIAFLSMGASSYVTGECIAADGGFLKYGF